MRGFPELMKLLAHRPLILWRIPVSLKIDPTIIFHRDRSVCTLTLLHEATIAREKTLQQTF